MISAPTVPGYEVYDLLGQGGFGTVYRARQLTVGRDVALKIDSRVLATERDRRRFLREVSAAGQLSGHPNVIDLYDAGTLADGRPYLVSELCPGGSLDAVLRREGPLAPARVREIGVGIADALAAAHAAGILHRDVKPANILMNRFGVPGLSDFGLASILDADGGQSATREALTPAYAAPEAFELADPAPTADVYSLAATLYALLAGQPPRFVPGMRPSIATIMQLHRQPVPDIMGVPRSMIDILRAGLASDPARRLPSAVSLRDALAAARLDAPAGPQAAPTVIVVGPDLPGPPAGTGTGTAGPGTGAASWTPGTGPWTPGTGPWSPSTGAGTTGTTGSPGVGRTGATGTPGTASPDPAGRLVPRVPGQTAWPNLPATHPSAPVPRQQRLGALAGLAALGLVGSGLLTWGVITILGPGTTSQGGAGPEPAKPLPSTTGAGASTAASGSTPSGPTASSERAGSAGPSGAAAILAAVNAYRRTVGGSDPFAVSITFYPNPGPGEQASAFATLPNPTDRAIADEYRYSEGTVRDPSPPVPPATDVPALSWRFSAVAWPKMAAMLQTTDRVCRATMQRAKLPDRPDQSGDRAGITHVIVERDTAFYDGKVIVRVYFGGGGYWQGGYVPFYADGTKITDTYCASS